MKKFLKEMLPAGVLSLIVSFMIFIYEPIITYSANIDDFWFDFKLMLPNIMLYCAILFVILLILFIMIYFLGYLITKKSTFYKIALAIFFVIFVYLYIQGNFLIGNLPTLDGTTITWDLYTKDNIISIVVAVILLVAEILLIRVTNLDKTLQTNKYLSIIIFVMLLTSLISVLINPAIYREKIVATATNRNINNASQNKNFYIFLVDAVDSSAFSKMLSKNDNYSSTFENFTYFPDTVSAYTFTRDSIPFIFSGIWNENKTEFNEYCNMAFDNSKLLDKLKNNKYQMNFYEYQVHWSDRNVAIFDNMDIYNDEIDKIKYFKNLSKYVLFKYLPYPLKRYSRIENADFDSCRIDEEGTYYSWDNDVAYENIKNNEIELIDKNYFQFLHIEGAHTPFNYDENMNKIPEAEGTYEKKIQATIKIIDAFISRLKKYNVYDNSVIIVMADHGYWYNNNNGRQNPILYIKGIDEHHKMKISEIPVSFQDLPEAYIQLLKGQKSEELFAHINSDRTRRFINNPWEGEDNMVEYEVKGKAWDSTAVFETGKKFDR